MNIALFRANRNYYHDGGKNVSLINFYSFSFFSIFVFHIVGAKFILGKVDEVLKNLEGVKSTKKDRPKKKSKCPVVKPPKKPTNRLSMYGTPIKITKSIPMNRSILPKIQKKSGAITQSVSWVLFSSFDNTIFSSNKHILPILWRKISNWYVCEHIYDKNVDWNKAQKKV